jgi:hypothetical protein
VKQQFRTWRTAARVLVLALVVGAIPLPSMAGEPGKSVATPLRASIAKAAAANGAALEQAKPATAPNKSDLGSTSFFKKPVGIAVLAIVGAGVGYMAYSMGHDRIHSVVRSTQ